MKINIVCIYMELNLEGGQKIWIRKSWIKTGEVDDLRDGEVTEVYVDGARPLVLRPRAE